jgi:coniferyl-aldehyde dehydrogenase
MPERALVKSPTEAEMLAHLLRQRSAFIAEGPVDVATRRDRLRRSVELLKANCDTICEAISADFGGRHPAATIMLDVQAPITALKYALKHADTWMRPQRRRGVFPFNIFGARAEVRFQPKGVVGVAGTWNAPLFMIFAPLASVFAAGNRAMVKPSDLSPRTSEWLAGAVAQYFDPLELSVVTGGVDVAQAFTRLPFDHLVFTGSNAIARSVMREAAAHLVPLTLELGGKSPAIIGRSADLSRAVERIAVGKVQNNGQICVTPDTIYVPCEQVDAFVAEFKRRWASMFPRISGNPDVTSVANERHMQRIEAKIEEARAAGVRVEAAGATDDGAADRRRPMRLVIDPPADSGIAREEIFGPAMAVAGYDRIEDVVARINAGERPLALYYFGSDAAEQEYVLSHTLSGGVTVNDVMLHVAVNDAPFGGVGASGMGHYNGPEGFAEFSHARCIYRAGWWDPRHALGMNPPFTDKFLKMLKDNVRRS